MKKKIKKKNTSTEEKEDEVLEDGMSLITEKSLKKEMKEIIQVPERARWCKS